MVSLYDKDGVEYRIDTYEDFIQALYDLFPSQFHNVDDVIEEYTSVFDGKIYDHYENVSGNLVDMKDHVRYIQFIINNEKRNSGRITKDHYKDVLEQILAETEYLEDEVYDVDNSMNVIGSIL